MNGIINCQIELQNATSVFREMWKHLIPVFRKCVLPVFFFPVFELGVLKEPVEKGKRRRIFGKRKENGGRNAVPVENPPEGEPDNPTGTGRAQEMQQPDREIAGVLEVTGEVPHDALQPPTPTGKRIPLVKQPACRLWSGVRLPSGLKKNAFFRSPVVSVGGERENGRFGHSMEAHVSLKGVSELSDAPTMGSVKLFSTVERSESSVRPLVNIVPSVRLYPEMPVLQNRRKGEPIERMKQTINSFSIELLSGEEKTEQQEEGIGRKMDGERIGKSEWRREAENSPREIRREKEDRLWFPLSESAPRMSTRPIAGERVRNVNTHIDRLIDHFEIHTTAPEMDLNRMKEMVVDVLTGAVNDFSRVGGSYE